MKLLGFIRTNVVLLICDIFIFVALISWDIAVEPSKFKIFFVSLSVICIVLICYDWVKKYKDFER